VNAGGFIGRLITDISINGGTLRATDTLGGLVGLNVTSGVIENATSINIASLTGIGSIIGGLIENNQGAVTNSSSGNMTRGSLIESYGTGNVMIQ